MKKAEKNLKKNKKKSIENVNLFKQEHMFKRVMSSSRNHLDDFRSKNQVFKKWQCYICNDFHFYRKCYYLFSSLAHEDWILRAEIKKMMKKALNEDEYFAEKIRKLQKTIKKKKKQKKLIFNKKH